MSLESQKENECSIEITCEEILAENLVTVRNVKIQEVQQIPNRIKSMKLTPKLIIIKLLKTKDRKKP